MAQITVNFTFHSGVSGQLSAMFGCPEAGMRADQFSNQWTEVAMAATQDGTGCDAFQRRGIGSIRRRRETIFQWGVVADIAGARITWW